MIRTLRTLVLLSIAVLSVVPAGIEANAQVTASTNLTDDLHKMAVMPAGTVSKQSNVEIRLAITNRSQTTKQYIVDFFVDQYLDTLKINVAPINMALAPGQEGLARAYWAPIYFPGNRLVLYRVKENQGGTEVVVGSGQWPLKIVDTTEATPPTFTATWLEPGELVSHGNEISQDFFEEDLRDAIDEMNAFGMDTIIITYPEYEWIQGWGPFYPTELSWLGSPDLTWIDDFVGTVFDQADINGQHVYVGLGRGTCSVGTSAAQCAAEGPLACGTGPTAEQLAHVRAQSEAVAQELWDLYGHYDSFYGWYLTHEFNDWNKCDEYYNGMASWLDRFGLEKPVLVAPGGLVLNLSSSQLAASGVDVFAYQDAVGCGYDDSGATQCTWDPYVRIADLEDVYAGYASKHTSTNKHIWDDLEIWQKPGPTYSSTSFAASCERVSDQMIVGDYVQQYTAYAYLGYLQSLTSPLEPREGGHDLYDAYKDYVDGVTSTLCGS